MFKIRNVNLETVCGVTSTLPENTRVEVAFAGRSNVGKSSLINSLMNRKNLARTSSQPGKTQTVNFYRVNEGTTAADTVLPEPFAPDCYLVDLPGYGYATAGLEVKAAWGKMIERYLRGSKKLRACFLLVDIRHEPTANDRQMFDWILTNGMAPVVVATKRDKLKRSQIPKALKAIREMLTDRKGLLVFPFSAETKEGLDEIWAYIRDLALEEEKYGDHPGPEAGL